MNLIKLTANLFFLIAVLSSVTAKAQQDDKTQRINASYLLAFGQSPRIDEVTYWKTQSINSLSQIMDLHKGFIKNGGYKREAIVNSYKDGLGRLATEDEIKFYSTWNATYTDLMKNHIQWLSQNPATYEQMIKDAFRYALRRQPSSSELTAWKNNSQKYSYVMLTGFLQSKINLGGTCIPDADMNFTLASKSIVTTRVSTTIGQEAKGAAVITTPSGGIIIGVGSGNIIGYNAGPFASSKDANFIVVGGKNIF